MRSLKPVMKRMLCSIMTIVTPSWLRRRMISRMTGRLFSSIPPVTSSRSRTEGRGHRPRELEPLTLSCAQDARGLVPFRPEAHGFTQVRRGFLHGATRSEARESPAHDVFLDCEIEERLRDLKRARKTPPAPLVWARASDVAVVQPDFARAREQGACN